MAHRPINLTRRLLLGASASAAFLKSPAFAKPQDQAKNQRLRYLRPAATWDEALPIGNGRLAAMVFGGVAQERLQLNEETLWAGSPYSPNNPDALAGIPEVRRLIEAGRYKEASDLASAKCMAKPLLQMPYGTLGDVLIDFQRAETPASYERTLDLDRAVYGTNYRAGSGEFLREAFVSAPDQVIVLHLEATGAEIDFDLSYRGPRKVKYASPSANGSATNLVADTSIDWLRRETAGDRSAELNVSADGSRSLLITGRNLPDSGISAGLRFALRLVLLSDGRVSIENERLILRGARKATLLIAAATSYVSRDDVSGDPVAKVIRQTDAAARKSYAALRRAHVQEYQGLYRTASFELPVTAAAAKPTDVRILESETSDDPALTALYFQFARYLLISSSRPGCQPANLQGKWNEGTNPPWGSKYTININTEMNYWPADPAGLGECVEPLLRLVEELSITGAETARIMYGARGWVAHHNTDLWRAAAPIDGPNWGLWPCGAAWLCNSLWDHYDYSRNPATLARIYPLLRGASLFFLDTLVEDSKGRGLITSPSLSPENIHPFGFAICAGPASDRQIIRDLFAFTIQAGKQLASDAELLEQIARAAKRLAPDEIGKQGQLQEWIEDWDAAAPDQHHRHVAHMYAVYPSSQINVRDTPKLVEAAKTTLTTRGDFATGWATAWRLCLWARMGEGNHAHKILKGLIGPLRTYPNMFDAHPPFQIDGNFGGAAGIMEMLVQSWGGEILLLPALPDAWPSGELRGFRARGAISVDMQWRDGKVRRLELTGPPGGEVGLRYGGALKTVKLDARGRYRRE